MSDFFQQLMGLNRGCFKSCSFCVYIDDLLLSLSEAGIGCYIGPNFVGALAYADDIIIVHIAPTTYCVT